MKNISIQKPTVWFYLLLIITVFSSLVFIERTIILKSQNNNFEKGLTHLEEKLGSHQALLESIHERKDRCEKETKVPAGSYGAYQYCLNFLNWLDVNPSYDYDVMVPGSIE